MGDWAILIRGHGIHDNGRQEDADQMAAVFVGELKAAGHEVTDCTFSLQHKNILTSIPFVSSNHEEVISAD
jgi:hypothetical protein